MVILSFIHIAAVRQKSHDDNIISAHAILVTQVFECISISIQLIGTIYLLSLYIVEHTEKIQFKNPETKRSDKTLRTSRKISGGIGGIYRNMTGNGSSEK